MPSFWVSYCVAEQAFNYQIPLIVKIRYVGNENIFNFNLSSSVASLSNPESRVGEGLNIQPCFFIPDIKSGGYIRAQPHVSLAKCPAIVLEGHTVSPDIETIKKISPTTLLLISGALHEQYGNQQDRQRMGYDIGLWLENPSADAGTFPSGRWGDYIKEGLALGCTPKNPRSLYIDHVFASTVEEQFPNKSVVLTSD